MPHATYLNYNHHQTSPVNNNLTMTQRGSSYHRRRLLKRPSCPSPLPFYPIEQSRSYDYRASSFSPGSTSSAGSASSYHSAPVLMYSAPIVPQNDTRKRQRRQAAGALVANIFGGGGGGSGVPDPAHHSSSLGPPGAAPISSPTAAADAANNRKSTAQPRPSIRIPPRGIGPVYDPNVNDVLCGRGGRINAHAGNVQFRDLVNERKKDYLAKETKKLEKAHIAAGIVKQIRDMQPAGRFLKEDADGSWYDIGMLNLISLYRCCLDRVRVRLLYSQSVRYFLNRLRARDFISFII